MTFTARNITILFGLSLLSIGAGYFFLFKRPPKKPDQNTLSTSALLPSQKTKILALGRLEPEGEITKLAGLVRTRIDKLMVSEGDWVKKGQVLAYLDNYQEMLARRDLATSQLEDVRKQLKTDSSLDRQEINQAKAQIGQIYIPKLSEIHAQEANVRRSKAELQESMVMRDRYARLYGEGAVPQEDFELRRLLVIQNQENLSQTEAKLEQLIAARKADLQAAQENIKHSQVNLKRVASHSGLNSAIQNLKLAQAQLDQTIIRSPKDGQVLKIYTHQGEAISDRGILDLANTHDMYAITEVFETDIKFIKVGQKATITSPVFSKKITGTVTKIGQMVFKNDVIGDDPTAKSDVRVVEVKVRLDQSQLVSNLTNLQVDAQIDLK